MASLIKRGSHYYLAYRLDGKQKWERLLIDGVPVTSKAQAKLLKTQRERELQILKTQKQIETYARHNQKQLDEREARQEFNQRVFGPALQALERRAIEEKQYNVTPSDFWKEFQTWAAEMTSNGARRSKNTVLAYETAWNRFFQYLKRGNTPIRIR
jgi:hypothetical protein